MKIFGFKITLFLFLFSQICFSQQCNWLSLIDCGGYMNIDGMDVDQSGDCIVYGRFSGEIAFNSVQPSDTIIRKYAEESWRKLFIVKYNAQGKVVFAIDMKSIYSNQDLMDFQDVKCMVNGDVLISLWFKDNFYIKDGTGTKTIIKRTNSPNALVRLNSEGKVMWTKNFEAGDFRFSEEDNNGNVLMYTHNTLASHTKNRIGIIDINGQMIKQTELPENILFHSLCVVNKEVLMLLSLNKRARTDVTVFENIQLAPQTYYILKTDLSLTEFTVETSFSPPAYGEVSQLILNPINKDNYNIILSTRNTNTSYVTGSPAPFMYKSFKLDPDSLKFNLMLISLDKKGNYLNHRIIPAAFFNNHLYNGNDGNLLLTFTAPRDGCVFGNLKIDSISNSPDIFNLVYAYLDNDLSILKAFNGGSTNAIHDPSFLKEKSGTLYGVSNLIDSGVLCNDTIITKWKSGGYIICVPRRE